MNGSAPRVDGESAKSFEGLGNFETAPTSIFCPPSSSKDEGGGSVGCNWSPAEEYSVDPEDKKRESARSSSRQSNRGGGGPTEVVEYHIAAVEGDSLEDSYYLIDTKPQFPVGVDVPGNQFFDVNALASKLASLEVTQGQVDRGGAEFNSSPVHRATGATAVTTRAENLATGFTEISLGGGEAHTVTVKVEKKGTTVSWEFLSEPKGLAFGLSFQEDDVAGAKSEQVERY